MKEINQRDMHILIKIVPGMGPIPLISDINQKKKGWKKKSHR